jgi:hypothetical protein
MCNKESFEEKIERAKKEAAERKRNMSLEELEQLKKASRNHSSKVRSEIERNFELDKRNNNEDE